MPEANHFGFDGLMRPQHIDATALANLSYWPSRFQHLSPHGDYMPGSRDELSAGKELLKRVRIHWSSRSSEACVRAAYSRRSCDSRLPS